MVTPLYPKHGKTLDYAAQENNLLTGARFDAEYLALNPNAVAPKLVEKGAELIKSTLINEYLDRWHTAMQSRPAFVKTASQMSDIFVGLMQDNGAALSGDIVEQIS